MVYDKCGVREAMSGGLIMALIGKQAICSDAWEFTPAGEYSGIYCMEQDSKRSTQI